MTSEYKDKDINLQDQCLAPIYFMANDFSNQWVTIIIPDILHGKLRQYEKSAYIIYPGYFEANDKQPYLINFPFGSFKKKFLSQFDVSKFEREKKIAVKFDIKKTKDSIEIKNIIQL